MPEWNIYITDHGEEHEQKGTPRFVVRARRIGDARIVYGVGDTERQARQDAYEQMEKQDELVTT